MTNLAVKSYDTEIDEAEIQPRAYPFNPSAKILGVSPSTLWMLARQERIKTIKVGGRRLIPATEINRILAEGTR
jgi:excisionase family DNA binding protein